MLDQTPTRASRVRLPSNAKLIGSPICPFVARARIVAHELGIDLPISFIDLFEKPRWFVENSPTGTVPALRWENEFIFESAVISEFLNEISPGDLHPAEPVARALNRSWIEFAGSILRQQYFMMTASSAEDSSRNRAGLITALERLERIVTPGPFFNGPSFAIVDAYPNRAVLAQELPQQMEARHDHRQPLRLLSKRPLEAAF